MAFMGDEPEPNVSGTHAGVVQTILMIVALLGYFTIQLLESSKETRRQRRMNEKSLEALKSVYEAASVAPKPMSQSCLSLTDDEAGFVLTRGVDDSSDLSQLTGPAASRLTVTKARDGGTEAQRHRVRPIQSLEERALMKRGASSSGSECSTDAPNSSMILSDISTGSDVKTPYYPKPGMKRQISGIMVPAAGGRLHRPRVSVVPEVDERRLSITRIPSPRFNHPVLADSVALATLEGRTCVLSPKSTFSSSAFASTASVERARILSALPERRKECAVVLPGIVPGSAGSIRL